MINTATDFENSIQFLMSGMTDEQNNGLKYQIKTFKSDDFNSTFDVIESRLNRLYEKTRIMEDVIAYTKEYLAQNIYNTSSECHAIMNSIEDNRDKLKTNSYISYNIPMLEGVGSYLDRDNTQLSHCNVNNNTLTLSGKAQIDVPIKSIERKQGLIPYKSSLEDLLNGKVYRAFYLLDGPITNGLKEEIYIEFNSPTVINYIDIMLSCCSVSNVRYINDNGGIEYEDKFASIITRERKVKAIQLTLTSTSYKTSTYYIDQSRMASNFWSSVNNMEYNNAAGITQNISDLDVSAGIQAFKSAYQTYVAAMQSWRDRRAAVASANQSNGYSDSVPYTDLIIAPTAITSADRINMKPFNADPYPSAEQNIRYVNGGY
jgi:hypothetical protein